MASSSQARKPRKPNKTKKPRRTHFKNQLRQPKAKAFDHMLSPQPSPSRPPLSELQGFPCSLSSTTTSNSSGFEVENANSNANANAHPNANVENGCCTPKAHRFRIPEIETCPPAPKKQRVMRNCALRRRPIAFFAPPDIELFFVFARREQQLN